MTDFTANFTLEELESITADFVITCAISKTSQLENDSDFVSDADYVHTDNNFTDILLANLNNQSGVNTGDITVTDSSEIDFILTGQSLTANIKSASIDEDKLDISVNASLDLADTALQSFTETDPVFTASPSHSITNTDISNWDSKQPAGDYATNTDLTNGLGTKQDTLGYIPENTANKGDNNGYCGLDSGGKVPIANLPTTLLQYQGVWNASTNTPTLTNPDLTKVGYVYNVSVAGTQFSINWSLGDWLIYNASGVVEKSDNSDDVVSVNGQTGVVVLDKSDVGLGNVDNTSDANKPVSTAQQTALNLKANLAGGNTFTGDQTFDTNTLFIDSVNDRVGVGTTAPNGVLNIEGVVSNATLTPKVGALLSISNTSNDIDLAIGQMSGSPYATWVQARNNNVVSASYPLALNPLGGNVGIGTINPSTKLEVAGVIKSTDTTAATSNTTGSIVCAGGMGLGGDIHLDGTEITVASKNKHKIYLNDGSDALFRNQTSFWNGTSFISDNGLFMGIGAGQGNSGSNSDGFGTYALGANSGLYCDGFGKLALQYNTGTNCCGFGYGSLRNNTAANCNGQGFESLRDNTGLNANGFGYAALRSNTGINVNGFGYSALVLNTGANCNGFGYLSGWTNVADNCNGFGSYTLRYNNWANSIAIGSQPSTNFMDNVASTKSFTDTEITSGTITFTAVSIPSNCR